MADQRNLEAGVQQQPSDPAAGLALAGPTAETATTGLVLGSMVARGPSSRKSAPAASTAEALCMTSSCDRSE